jgi:hypothetical protein
MTVTQGCNNPICIYLYDLTKVVSLEQNERRAVGVGEVQYTTSMTAEETASLV